MVYPGFRSGRPRRSPYPFGIKVSGQGLLLGRGRGRDGRPTSEFVETTEAEDQTQAAPSDYGYSAQNPKVERVQSYGDFSGGMGLKVQQGPDDKRYRYTIAADLSVPRVWQKGPSITTVTPTTTDATNGVSGFFEQGGVLYAVVGRYALVRGGDTGADWTVSKDFGSGEVAVDHATFAPNTGTTTYTFVALGDDDGFWYFNGTTWLQHSLKARAFARVGSEFYRAHASNLLAKVDVDTNPLDVANWSADNAFYVGDYAANITRLAVTAGGDLVVLKTDGAYTLDQAGDDHELYPFLRFSPGASNGKGYGAFLNDLLVPFANGGLYRIGADFAIESVGLERLTSNDSEVRGRVTAVQGHSVWHAYAGVYNGTDSYLCKLMPDGAWHGSISAKFASKQITALYRSTIGAASAHSRMYVGFSDGTIGWFLLPNDPNPAADTSYPYTTTDGEIYPPLLTGIFANDPKVLFAASVNGNSLNSTNYVTLSYKTDPAVSTYVALAGNFDAVREQVDFPDNTSGILFDLKFVLVNTATTASPQVTGIGIHHSTRPERREIYRFHVLCADGLIRRDGVPLRIGRTRIRQIVEAARDAQGAVTILLPDESSQQVVVTRYQETTAFDDWYRKWQAALLVEGVQQATNLAFNYGRLESYTYGALKAVYTYRQLKTL